MYAFFILLLCSLASSVLAYDLPNSLNLGFTNILDGGPIRPEGGWYFYQYFQYYTSDKFHDNCGKCLGGVPSPRVNIFDGTSELIWQTDPIKPLKAMLGLDLILPYIMYSKVKKNSIDITDRGAGVGDLLFGPFIQMLPIMKGERPIFVHRFCFWASFPTGKFCATDSYNPGNDLYYLNPHWGGSLYFTPSLVTSWRLNYVWSSENKKTNIQPGQAIFYDYSVEYEALKDFWISATGYYLKQFTDSKIKGIATPGRREQVFAIGPGFLYNPTQDISLLSYVYFETLARNRTQGINFIARCVIHF